MTVSTLTVVPEASASGTAPSAEPVLTAPPWYRRSTDVFFQAVARACRSDYPAWLEHVRPAASCTRPIRLAGQTYTVETATGRILSTVDTSGMPDGVIYKPCGNRRESMCPACSKRYQRDAYQIVRAGLTGGKGVPKHVGQHPAVFPTLTAPSFGPVHTRHVARHTCTSRRTCDCRPELCRPRRDDPICGHGARLACYARHATDDARLGTPMCLDCYDYDHQAVWNAAAGELWRRTTIAVNRHLRRLARARGINPATLRLSFGKAAEMQRRAAIHFHAIVRLDGHNPQNPTELLPPPSGLDAKDLVAAFAYAARMTGFTTAPHPAQPDGWRIGWGEQAHTRIISLTANGEITDTQVAAYIAKYATKATEITGHSSGRLTDATIGIYADPDGTHTQRLIEACWILGQPRPWRGLRRWAHMLGYGGHFLTKSRHYSITFTHLRQQRVTFRRRAAAGPDTDGRIAEQPTTLVVSFLEFVGAGWHTTADALLAQTSAAMAREHRHAAQEHLRTTAHG